MKRFIIIPTPESIDELQAPNTLSHEMDIAAEVMADGGVAGQAASTSAAEVATAAAATSASAAAAEPVAAAAAAAASPALLAAAALGALVLLGVAYMLLCAGGGGVAGGKKVRRKKAVLLLGPCGGGKTVAYHSLLAAGASGEGEAGGAAPPSAAIETVTSMIAAEADFSLAFSSAGSGRGAATPVTLVDYPGHARLRAGLGEQLGRAAGVVLIVDATQMSAQLRPAAEVLYQVLRASKRGSLGALGAAGADGARGVLVLLNKASHDVSHQEWLP